MRLIDADKLLEETRKDRDYAEKNGFLDMYYERQVLIDRIESQPTAYDVDKLAEWLEELKVIIKEMDLSIPQHFTKEQSDWIKKYCINRNKEFYNKAIDDAKSVILQTLDNEILVDTLHLRLEQLKEQDK